MHQCYNWNKRCALILKALYNICFIETLLTSVVFLYSGELLFSHTEASTKWANRLMRERSGRATHAINYAIFTCEIIQNWLWGCSCRWLDYISIYIFIEFSLWGSTII